MLPVWMTIRAKESIKSLQKDCSQFETGSVDGGYETNILGESVEVYAKGLLGQ